jgi:hypothetical protein
MTYAPRYVEKFMSYDEAVSYVFGLGEYEWESEQGLRTGSTVLVGADYSYDSLGYQRAPKENARESVRCMLFPTNWQEYDAMIDEAKGKCREIGMGKLFTVDELMVRRWSWARLVNLPRVTVSTAAGRVVPFAFEFDRHSDWFDLSSQQQSVNLNAASVAFNVYNPGNAPARSITMRLHSESATGFTNPIIANQRPLNTYQIASTRDATSANSELRIITEQYRVQYSNDGGLNYADDYSLVTIPANQVGLMEFQPGDNPMVYTNTGVPNAVLEISFNPAYN